MKVLQYIVIMFFSCAIASASASTTIKMYNITETGKPKLAGTIIAKNTRYGLLLSPQLDHLPPGLHGFHLHEHPSCDNQAQAAGGHWDPSNTKKHLGPYSRNGHLGDMPALFIDKEGKATLPVLAPRLREIHLRGHAFVVHQFGDNYSDQPKKLGGGGARLICGTV